MISQGSANVAATAGRGERLAGSGQFDSTADARDSLRISLFESVVKTRLHFQGSANAVDKIRHVVQCRRGSTNQKTGGSNLAFQSRGSTVLGSIIHIIFGLPAVPRIHGVQIKLTIQLRIAAATVLTLTVVLKQVSELIQLLCR